MSFGQGVKLTTKKPTQITVKSTGVVSFLPISKLSTSIFKLAKWIVSASFTVSTSVVFF